MITEAPPRADQLDNAPHPRDTVQLFGQGPAEAAFLAASAQDRIHHAWLIQGPEGIGKATLAWRLARFILAQEAAQEALFGAPPPPETLDIPADHPVARRIAAGSEPRLFSLIRAWDDKTKRARSVITVEEVRKLAHFFAMSVVDGGRRVVIVDAVDEMNVNAANALLKMLEEPPEGAVLLLVSHQPARLLPTIRSRCRTLACKPLAGADLARALAATGAGLPDQGDVLAELASGSVRRAFQLVEADGVALYGRIIKLIGTMPKLDRAAAIAFSELAAGRANLQRTELIHDLLTLALSRLARQGVGHPPALPAAPGETEILARLCPNARAARAWAECQQSLGARAAHGQAVNLDPAALLLDMVVRMNETAITCLSRQ